MRTDSELLNHLKVGIIGCGHLGQAIAQSLVKQGIERKNLLLSSRGSPLTQQKLEALSLTSCLTTNQKILDEAGIVFITIKPQDFYGLKGVDLAGKALIVSCMAGVTIESYFKILGKNVYRMMFSGPDTILSGKGVAAMYPEHEHLNLLLRFMNLTIMKIRTENDLDIFTTGVCVPAALLKAGNPNQQNAINKIGAEYPLLSELYGWAQKAIPDFTNDADKVSYIERMITKGGVTEAIINSMADGASFDVSLQRGINRTKEISKEIQQLLVYHA